ncbi:MAG: inorganic diphosphatase [Candidatus Vogelbacteria bacterium]|nr:inorganic diphosphatase [Candidatus Vogelbacteria bacterium]
MYKAYIEIPKGDGRRRHMKYDKSGLIDLGPIKDVIPVNEGIMPVHYGFIKDTVNKEEDSEHEEELDVLVFSSRDLKPADEVLIKPIGLIKREDKDEKILAVEIDFCDHNSWSDIPLTEQKIIKDYFGYKSPIVEIVDEAEALTLIKKSQI